MGIGDADALRQQGMLTLARIFTSADCAGQTWATNMLTNMPTTSNPRHEVFA